MKEMGGPSGTWARREIYIRFKVEKLQKKKKAITWRTEVKKGRMLLK
jgi:hypothetical protein